VEARAPACRARASGLTGPQKEGVLTPEGSGCVFDIIQNFMPSKHRSAQASLEQVHEPIEALLALMA
jgi:hypothetical protein